MKDRFNCAVYLSGSESGSLNQNDENQKTCFDDVVKQRGIMGVVDFTVKQAPLSNESLSHMASGRGNVLEFYSHFA